MTQQAHNSIGLYSTLLCMFLRGRSDGAIVLSKLSVPGRPTNLDNIRARAYCACSRCGWGPIETVIVCQRAVKPNQTINQPCMVWKREKMFPSCKL